MIKQQLINEAYKYLFRIEYLLCEVDERLKHFKLTEEDLK